MTTLALADACPLFAAFAGAMDTGNKLNTSNEIVAIFVRDLLCKTLPSKFIHAVMIESLDVPDHELFLGMQNKKLASRLWGVCSRGLSYCWETRPTP